MVDASVVRSEGEGEALWFLGGLYEVKLSSDDTNGAMTVMQFTIPEGASPPIHAHDQDETVYVAEGKARFHIGGEIREAGPGSVVHFPAGTQETFEPVGGRVKLVATYTPGGIDKFFREAADPAATREVPPPPASPPDFEQLAKTAATYGLHIVGPPSG